MPLLLLLVTKADSLSMDSVGIDKGCVFFDGCFVSEGNPCHTFLMCLWSPCTNESSSPIGTVRTQTSHLQSNKSNLYKSNVFSKRFQFGIVNHRDDTFHKKTFEDGSCLASWYSAHLALRTSKQSKCSL